MKRFSEWSTNNLSLRTELSRAFTGLAFITIFQLAASLAVSVLLARTLGTGDFGAFSFILSIVSLLALPAYIGLPPLLSREVAIHDSRDNWAYIKGLTRWSKTLILTIALPITLMTLLVASLKANWTVDDKWTLLTIGALCIPILGIINSEKAVFLGLRRVTLGNIPDMIVRPTVLLFSISALILFEKLNLISALFSYVIALTSCFALSLALLRAIRPANYKNLQTLNHNKRWIRSLTPFSAIVLVSYLNTELFIPLLGLFNTDEQVAFFRVALTLALVVSLPLTLVESVIHPHVSRLYLHRNGYQLKRLIFLSGISSFLLSLPLVIIFAIFGNDLISLLYGSGFEGAYLPMLLLSVGLSIMNLIGPSMLLLHATEFEHDAFIVSLVSLFIIVTLSLIVIPAYGALGAAIIFALGKLLRAISFRICAQYRLNSILQTIG